MSELERLIDQVCAATSFEEAADCALATMESTLTTTLASSAGGNDVRFVRAMVHLRPGRGGAYHGLFVRSTGGPARAESHGMGTLPSVTAWYWLETADAAILLDVREQMAIDQSGASVTHVGNARPDFRSRQEVLQRETSHIAALPLRRPGGGLVGFVSIELMYTQGADNRGADNGKATRWWPALAASLQPYANAIAAPLLMLPHTRGGSETQSAQQDRWLPVVGASMRPLIEDLRLFATTDDILLLYGESGVGKTRLARWCHEQSPRAGRQFVHATLGTNADGVRPAMLFGWKRGAFTDAVESNPGLVGEARGGTLFLDEIDKLPRDAQAMLLGLLDDGGYRVVGDHKLSHADVRIIVGTNANLKEAVAEGRFLLDLYHRIHVFPVQVPPLRERRDEICDWARFFIARAQKRLGSHGAASIETTAAELLEQQPWPGNLRQLESTIKRAVLLAHRDSTSAADHGVEHDQLRIARAHVARSLAYDQGRGPEALLTAMATAAEAFVDTALARAGGLELKHSQVLTGMVLKAAVDRLGDGAAACRLLGRGKDVDSNNHQKLIKRESQRADDLAAILVGDGGDRTA